MCRMAERIVLGQDLLTKQLESKIKNSSYDVDFWACTEKVHKTLNWQSTTTVMNGIEKTWNWTQHK